MKTSVVPYLIRSVLLASALFAGLAGRSSADQPREPMLRAATRSAVQGDEAWKTGALGPLDLKLGDQGSDGARSVTVTVDRAGLLATLPTVQEHGAFSRTITGEEVAKHPYAYTNVLSLLLTSYAVRDLYAARPELGATRWTVLLSDKLAGGRDAREMFSFAFSRPLYEDTDWDRLAFTELPNVARDFSYNLIFTLQMSRELTGSIDDD